MTQTEINIPSNPQQNVQPKVPQTANTLPDIFVGARKLLRNSPWMSSMGFGFIVPALVLMPAISIWYMDIYPKNKNEKWQTVLRESLGHLETFRWSIIGAFFSFVFFMSLAGFCLAPIATKHFKKKILKRFGQLLGTIRYNLAFFTAAIVTLIFYLNTGFDVAVDGKDHTKYLTALESESQTRSDVLTGSLQNYQTAIIEIIMSRREYFEYIPYVLVLLSTSLLIEKLVILYISHNFHKSFYTKRIKRNNLVLSCYETLSLRHSPAGYKPLKSGAVLKSELVGLYSESIFNGLLKEGKESLLLDDFMAEIDHPVAVELFEFLDFNKSGDISLTEFKEAMHEAYEEKRMLLKSIKSNENVIDRIDTFFVTIIILFKFSLLLPKINISLLTFLGYIGGSALFLRSTLDHFLEQLFGAVMHFLVAHPYDVGDKIQMNHKNYRIKDMGFWKTTLISPDGKVSYVPNHTLFGVHFGNYRRSDRMETNIQMVMSIGTSKEDIKMYCAAINEFIKDNGRYLDEHIVIKEVEIVNSDAMSIVFGVMHKFNFNNDDNYHFRCELIFKNMTRIAKEQNLKYFALRFQEE